MFRDCCTANEDLAPQAIAASLLVDAAIVLLAAIVAVTGGERLRRAAATAAVLAAVAVIAASTLVSGFGYAPVVERDPHSLVCRPVGSSRLCVWPERSDRLALLTQTTGAVLESWARAGISVPPLISEASSAVSPSGTLSTTFAGVRGDDQAILALSSGMVPPAPTCPGTEPGTVMATTGSAAAPYLEAWYALAGGMSRDGLRVRYQELDDIGIGPPVVATADAVAAASPERRAQWAAKVAAQVSSCDPISVDVSLGP